jgi:hypothetical protein
MALEDADFRFIWVEVGANGASSDAQIFNSCELKEAILDGSIDFSAPEPIVERHQDVPYFSKGILTNFPLRYLYGQLTQHMAPGSRASLKGTFSEKFI